jgi:DNA-binding transcriptional ArsR family regulator
VQDVDVAAVARLLGDESRSAMLAALMDGRALTAGELARAAGIGAPAASGQLAKLLDGGVVEVAAEGRHRYYRIASSNVALALEALAVIAAATPVRTLRTSSAAQALKPARLCYDHIAGVLGVRIHDHLHATGAVGLDAGGMTLTDAGRRWFADAGVDVDAVPRTRRPLLRPCLDWTERCSHLAGALPARLATVFIDQGWLRRRAPAERGLTITDTGSTRLAELLGVEPGVLSA